MEDIIKDHIYDLSSYLDRCYSPYSKFNVACMLVLPDKNYYGVNVENCSYSLTCCAEKNCITSAITDNTDLSLVKYIVLITDTANTITPCGACRQILAEFFDKNMKIYTQGNNKIINMYTVGTLLPGEFILD
jgi:cytidine deaminase